MVSFQQKLVYGLTARGLNVCYELADTPYQAVLVIGGTRQLGGLFRARRKGIPIVQRLDGMNWLHRLSKQGKPWGGLRHFLRAEYGNILLSFLRANLASHVVYQSEFVAAWWERVRGRAPVPSTVIYNGVDLGAYTPHGPGHPPTDHCRLLMVEGSLMGGYEFGLNAAVELAGYLSSMKLPYPSSYVELVVVGRAAPGLAERWTSYLEGSGKSEKIKIHWFGLARGDQIPDLDRSAHLLYSADVNAACPNSVIEAMACGLPVLSFETGALPELVKGDAGRLVPYGGNPWRLAPPDTESLADSALEILDDPGRFRSAARARAKEAFGLDEMVDAYIDVLLGG